MLLYFKILSKLAEDGKDVFPVVRRFFANVDRRKWYWISCGLILILRCRRDIGAAVGGPATCSQRAWVVVEDLKFMNNLCFTHF